MASNVNEQAVWHDDLPLVEVGDPVAGGVTGPVNLQAKVHGDRALYLHEQIATLFSSLADLASSVASSLTGVLKKSENLNDVADKEKARENISAAAVTHGHDDLYLRKDKNLSDLDSLSTALKNLGGGVPSGLISMWSGALKNIPEGWGLCDGKDGRPNMLSKFVLGVSSSDDTPGGTGGSDKVTLSAANMPRHRHSFSGTTSSGGTHAHTYNDNYLPGSRGPSGDGDIKGSNTTSYAGAHTHTVSGNSGYVGSGTEFDIRPAYFVVAYIIKL